MIQEVAGSSPVSHPSMHRALFAGLLLFPILAGAGGCVLPAAALVGVASQAASAGYGVWNGSKFRYVDEASIPEMEQAIERTIERLALTVSKTRFKEDDGVIEWKKWRLKDDEGSLASLRILRMTPRMTIVEINVGPFGDRGAGRLVADRVKQELESIRAEQDAVMSIDPE